MLMYCYRDVARGVQLVPMHPRDFLHPRDLLLAYVESP